ncbi:hypothetical protein AgCh_007984 [Apium graveolens]
MLAENNEIPKSQELVVDGDGVKKGTDGNVVGMLMFGIEGIVVGNVGSDAGNGGTLGIVVGTVGRVGIVGSAGRGVVGNDGNATFGRVGIAGIGGNATLGNDGIVGSVGAELTEYILMLTSSNLNTKRLNLSEQNIRPCGFSAMLHPDTIFSVLKSDYRVR